MLKLKYIGYSYILPKSGILPPGKKKFPSEFQTKGKPLESNRSDEK